MNKKCSNCAANTSEYDDYCQSICKYGKQIKYLKAENEQIRQNSVTHETHKILVEQAVKKFTEKVKERLCTGSIMFNDCIVRAIDEIIKENQNEK